MTFREKLQRRARKMFKKKALINFTPYDIILAPVLTEKPIINRSFLENMFLRCMVMLIKMTLVPLFSIFMG